jgi:hypothetical protein
LQAWVGFDPGKNRAEQRCFDDAATKDNRGRSMRKQISAQALTGLPIAIFSGGIGAN